MNPKSSLILANLEIDDGIIDGAVAQYVVSLCRTRWQGGIHSDGGTDFVCLGSVGGLISVLVRLLVLGCEIAGVFEEVLFRLRVTLGSATDLDVLELCSEKTESFCIVEACEKVTVRLDYNGCVDEMKVPCEM